MRIAQIEAGSRRSGFKIVDLSTLTTNVVDAFIPVADERGKTLTSTIDKGVILAGDKELLAQLIFNLIENAIQYSADDGCIHIGLRAADESIMLSVADNGPGIPKLYREKVFQRFYRVEQSRNMPGNGLGLSIARAIAELHNTKINLTDNMPGLKVTITFPYMRENNY